ncbi:MATE family efflux transporter [Cohnella fermenti]|uniref:MATE family efflux transporter n=1 Tax=Cohnella fermenti TaxID=2565925 RepID=A0A4S4C723_9BACL|nr:MATE family efflux transporter [Cohnella fermenti]THF83456.1 MATE family efflux transporter [Cohnella fermenti]
MKQARNKDGFGLWRLAWPIGVELLLQFLMGTVDTLMVSRIGDDAVSAVGVSNQVIQTAMTLFAVINAGAGAVIARMWGARQWDKARGTAAIAIQVNLLFGVAGGLIFAFLSPFVLRAMGVPSAVQEYGISYLSAVGGGIVVITLHLVVNALIRNIGNTVGPMLITVGMNVIHLILNYLLIFGIGFLPELGVHGTAISTLVSRLIALAAAFMLLQRLLSPGMTRRSWLRTDRGLLRDIVGIGLPVSVTAMSWGFSQIVLLSIVSSFGAHALASFTYVQTIQQFPWMIASAIGSALGIQVGQWHGAGRREQVHRAPVRAILVGTALVLGASVAIRLWAHPIVGVFTREEGIAALAIPMLALSIVWQPLRVTAFCLSNSLNIVGGARAVAVLSVVGMWFISTGGAYLFGSVFGWGLQGVLAAMIVDEAVRGAYFLRRWRRREPQRA